LIVMAQNPVPFISQPLVPDAIAPSAPGGPGFTFTLAVSGTGFVPGSKVNWNGSPRTTAFVDHSRLIAFILSSDLARPSTASITVVSPTPGGGTSNAVFLPIHQPSSTVSFGRTDYPVGANPQYVATADFNRDGKLDLVSANFGSGSVSVLLGNGDGTFRSHTDYAAGSAAQVPIVGDFNGDGILDLAVPYFPCSVAVLLGRGDGTFQPAVSYSTGCNTTHGITADFNGDGKLDLAIVNWGSGPNSAGVSILLGNGDGTFQPSVDYVVGDTTTQAAAGDFNRDGKLDLAVSWGGNTVSILLGNGDGTFQPQVDYATGANPGGVVIADLNGDGKLDLVVANQGSPTVSVLLGNGDGTFRSRTDYPVTADAIRVDVGDFNQDGKLDLAVSTFGSTVDILLGNGDGTFQAPLSFRVGSEPWNALPGDFNGDGRLDIATGNFNDGTVSVLLATSTSRH
jgi:VCBS repeat protein/FG-GAP repeat protein